MFLTKRKRKALDMLVENHKMFRELIDSAWNDCDEIDRTALSFMEIKAVASLVEISDVIGGLDGMRYVNDRIGNGRLAVSE